MLYIIEYIFLLYFTWLTPKKLARQKMPFDEFYQDIGQSILCDMNAHKPCGSL